MSNVLEGRPMHDLPARLDFGWQLPMRSHVQQWHILQQFIIPKVPALLNPYPQLSTLQ